MKNVTFKKEGAILTIRVDLSAKGELSKSGKSEVVATTNGNQEIGDGLMLGLNIFKVTPKSQWTEAQIIAAFKAKLARQEAKQAVKG